MSQGVKIRRWRLTFPIQFELYAETLDLATLGFKCLMIKSERTIEVSIKEDADVMGMSLEEYFSVLVKVGITVEEI